MPCDDCYAFYTKKGLDTPCSSCPKPVLMQNNSLAWELFCHLSTQVVSAGMGGIAGFNMQALQFLFDLYEVPSGDRKLLFEKVTLLANLFLKHMREKGESARQTKK